MSVVVIAGASLVAAIVFGIAIAFAARGRAPIFKGVSPVMLTPLAVLFGLIVAFLASQVFSDSQRANGAVAREASALRTVVLLAADFPGETEARIRALVRRHIQEAVNREWPAMARQEATLAMLSAAAACIVLIASHNRPFTGEISVGPALLLQVMPQQ